MNITVTLRAHDNTLPVDELAAFAERKPDLFADPFGRLKKTSSQGEG